VDELALGASANDISRLLAENQQELEEFNELDDVRHEGP
jgi:hypothetical protein